MRKIKSPASGSMSRYLLLSTLALVLAPILILGSLTFTLLNTHFHRESAVTVRAIMRSMSEESASHIDKTFRLVEHLSVEFAGSTGFPAPGKNPLLETARNSSPTITSIVVLNGDFRVVCSTPPNPDLIGADYSRRPFLIDLAEKKRALSMPFVNPETGTVNVGVAKKHGNAIVVAFLDLDALSDTLKSLRYSEKDEAALADGTGIFIAHTDRRLVRERSREPMHAELREIAGETLTEKRTETGTFAAAGMAVAGTPWTVLYYRDSVDAYALIQNLADRYSIAVIVIAFIAFVTVILSRNAFSKRISMLLAYIENTTSEEPSADLRYGDDPWREFRKIGDAFKAMHEQIRERENALRKSEDQYRGLFLRNTAPTLIVDSAAGLILDANPAAVGYYGFSRAELLALQLQDLSEPAGSGAPMLGEEEKKRTQALHRNRHRLANGEIRDVEMFASPVEWEGKKSIYTIVIDITERISAEKQVEHSLAEKNILLREIHHRVKNNLQIMASLLHLQSRYVRDAADEELFEASQNRIRSMALIHELIYQREDLSSVDLAEYVQSLVRHYEDGASRTGVKIESECVSLATTPDIALPFGLILNELFSNSIKHAFPENRLIPAPCRISVVFRTTEEDGYELIYSDNGVGLPPSVDPEQTDSLGLSLIRILAAQLGSKPVFLAEEGFGVRLVLRGK